MTEKNRTEQIRELVDLARELGLASFSYEDEDVNIAFEFMGAHVAHSNSEAPVISSDLSKGDKKPVVSIGYSVEAPLGGNYYSAPAPGMPIFVSVGKVIEAGQTLCIIEAMKVMNEIIAEKTSRVLEIFCSNGESVSFGQKLFILEDV